MRRDHPKLAHFGAPVAFLLAVTIVVLLIHGSFSGRNSKHTSSRPVTTTAPVTSAASTARTVTTQIYTIRSGDTLGAVAIHFGVTVDDILALNPGIDPTALRVGQKVKIGKAPAAK